MKTNGLDQILDLLTLAQSESLVFTGPASHERHIRAFGGQVAAQALMAAGLTASEQRSVNSLHGYFLRPGKPDSTIEYQVKPVRDGRSFSIREVTAIQEDQVIFQMNASFHISEQGVEHSEQMPSSIPDPETLAPFEERFAGREDHSDMGRWFTRARPFDIRYIDTTPFETQRDANRPIRQRVWIKTIAPLPNDALLHYGIAAYLSDLTVLDAILLTHDIKWTDRKIIGASLDHAMWFHRPFRTDEWLLFDQESPTAFGARGLAQGKVWTQDGKLVASIAQEALLRPPGK